MIENFSQSPIYTNFKHNIAISFIPPYKFFWLRYRGRFHRKDEKLKQDIDFMIYFLIFQGNCLNSRSRMARWIPRNLKLDEKHQKCVQQQRYQFTTRICCWTCKLTFICFIFLFFNVTFLLQLWYEVTCDIASGSELLLGPKVPLVLSEMLHEGGADDRSGSGQFKAKQSKKLLKHINVSISFYFRLITF